MRKNDVFFILILLVTLFAIYWHTFDYDLIWDSKLLLESNILIEQNKPLLSSLKVGYFREQMGGGKIDFYYRPLLTASFVLEHKIWGIQTATLRITNLVLFILTLFFLFLFFKAQFQKRFVAEFIVMIFAFYPLNAENIVWIVGRGDLLLIFWGSLSFLFLEYFIQKKHYRYAIFSSIFYLMGIFSKESFLFFLPLLFLYEFLKNKRITLPYHITNLLFTFLFFVVKNKLLKIESLGQLPLSDILTSAKSLLPSLGYYCRSMLFPINYDMFVRLEYLDGFTYIAFGIGFILAIAGALFLSKKIPDLLVPLILMVVFISGHLLLIFTILYPYKVYARYMIFPALCIIWILAILIRKMKEKMILAFALILVFIFIPSTIYNANAFKSETQYFQKALGSFPNDSYILFQMGLAFFNKEDFLSAELYLNRTLSLPTRSETALLVSILYSDIDFKRAKYDNVYRWLEAIDELKPSQYHQLPPLIQFQNKLKKILVEIYKGKSESAERLLFDVIAEYPDRSESYIELHRLYLSSTRWDDALRVEKMVQEKFRHMNDLNTNRIRAEFNSFNSGEKIAFYIQNRNFKAAIDLITTLTPLDLEHKILLAKLHYWRGEGSEGMRIIEEDILAEQPKRSEVLNRIGTFYLQDLYRVQQAIPYFTQSLEINPNQANISVMVRRLEEDYLEKLNDVWPDT